MPGNNPPYRTSVTSDSIENLRVEGMGYRTINGRDTSVQPWIASGQSIRANCPGGGRSEPSGTLLLSVCLSGAFRQSKPQGKFYNDLQVSHYELKSLQE